MYGILSIITDVLAAAIILLPVLIVWQNRRQQEVSIKRKCVIILLALYIAAVFSVVGIPSVCYVMVDLSVNLIPIVTMPGDLKEPLLNVILFMPLGFILPILWKRFQSVKNIIIAGLSLSLFIEILQIFTYRATDINDLITNTIGTLVGYLIAACLNRKMSGMLYMEETGQCKWEFECICGIVFLVMFFISYFISNVIWNILI